MNLYEQDDEDMTYEQPVALQEVRGQDVLKLILWLEKLTRNQLGMVELQVRHEIERRDYVGKGFKR
jgi:hypothetical protein